MKQNNDPIRQENKKALPKFVLISVGGVILGGVLGLHGVSLHLNEAGELCRSQEKIQDGGHASASSSGGTTPRR